MSTITKGKFSDGHTGWKVSERKTNGIDGFEIHWSDDGECVTDHVYTIEDANLIASSPQLLEMIIRLLEQIDNEHVSDIMLELAEEAKILSLSASYQFPIKSK